MADFHVTQQVVCIFAGPWRAWPKPIDGVADPHKGAIYTIDEILECPFRPDVVGLHLAERPGSVVWTSDGFRPVRKTDISEIEKLLIPKDARTKELV